MAVPQNSDGNSEKQVEEEIGPSCREGADAGPCEFQLRKSDGPSTRPRDLKKDASGMVKSYKLRQNRNEDNKSDNLSDIDDAEVCGYLNTKEEIHLKRILWEAMNGQCTKAKKRKRTEKTEKRKGDSIKKAAKTTEKSEFEGRSSRINYDALKLLNNELEQISETAQIIGADSSANRTENSLHGNISDYRECNESFGHHEGGMHYEYGEENFDDEYFDF